MKQFYYHDNELIFSVRSLVPMDDILCWQQPDRHTNIYDKSNFIICAIDMTMNVINYLDIIRFLSSLSSISGFFGHDVNEPVKLSPLS